MGLLELVCLGLLAVVGRAQESQNCIADSTLLTVSSTDDADELATSLECAFGDFFVRWAGDVLVEKTIRVSNGTSLNITGSGPGATANGNGVTQLFVVHGDSTLHLSDMSLAHGNASSDGGAIHAEWSSVSISGSTSFMHNSAGGNGGAVFAFDSNIFWDGDDIVFSDNHAGIDGGAIFSNLSHVTFEGDGTEFSENNADDDGGAIYLFDSTLSWDGDGTEFIENNADDNGGAICLFGDSNLSWIGDGTEFSDNYAVDDGGALYLYNSTLSWIGDDTEFRNNSAYTTANFSRGGALCLHESTLSWVGDGTGFSKNKAAFSGGALSLSESTLSWVGDGTEFSENNATYSGGVICLDDHSTLSWVGDGTEFSENNADDYGGAIYLTWSSNLSWAGDGTEFSENNADDDGGAFFLSSSTLSWVGDGTEFSENNADGNGGAIFLSEDSTLSWVGDGTEFSENNADIDGGAIHLSFDSTFSWVGDGTEYSKNYAGSHGGAIYSDRATFSWVGDGTVFSENNASYGRALSSSWDFDDSYYDRRRSPNFGGAIYLFWSTLSWVGDGTRFSENDAFDGGAIRLEGSDLSWVGNGTEFSKNNADDSGGVIHSRSSNLSWVGDGTNFGNNSATAGFGGAVYAEYTSAISWDGPTSFTSNFAGGGGGAIALVDFGYTETVFANATFIANSAGTGGAFYLYNSGLGFNFVDLNVEMNLASGDGGAFAIYGGTNDEAATFTRCDFSGNIAVGAGGAVETLSGKQEFVSCGFEGNSADIGGALTLGGDAFIGHCSFRGNFASTRGLAIAVVGSANIANSSFAGNELYCAPGSYREDSDMGDDNPRFDVVCLECPSMDVCSGCNITRGNLIPACVAPLDHASAEVHGVTLETLNVTKGYWRATNTSVNILACPNADACNGGQTGAEDYCSTGHEGPYCALCESGFAPSLGQTCTRCSSSTRHGLIAATAIIAVVVACAIAAVFKFFLSTELQDRNVGWFHRRVVRAIPVQSLKIIVVVWQILTQFADAASVTYPGVYQDFLNAVAIVNFDLGSVLAAGCMWSGMDFHDRLLMSTVVPLAIAGLLASTYKIAMLRNGAAGNTTVAGKVRHKHQTALLLLTFLVYSSVSSMVFQTFACETLDDGVEYLRADYSILCTDAKHMAFQVYAGIMIFVYPVGIPLLYAIMLYQHRDVLSDAGADKDVAQPISSLWEPYRPKRFYYEVVECGRRIMLTGVVVFIFPNSAAQIAITMLVAFFFSAVFDVLLPYKLESDMWLSRGGHVIVFLSMFDTLLLRVDVSSESDKSQAVFAGVLVAGHVLMVLAIVVEVAGICFASRKKKGGKVAFSSQTCPELGSPVGSDDGVSAFKSVPASWRPFTRQVSVSEEPRPTRGVSGPVGVAGRS